MLISQQPKIYRNISNPIATGTSPVLSLQLSGFLMHGEILIETNIEDLGKANLSLLQTTIIYLPLLLDFLHLVKCAKK